MKDALPLFCFRFGQGEPLIILHGFLGMSDNWVTFGKRLSKEFQVIIPDLRNHGRSPHSDDFGFDEMMADINLLLDNNGITTANFLGHSMGGKLAMMLALNYPERIRKCEIVDISPFSLPVESDHLALLRIMQGMELKKYKLLTDIGDNLRETIEDEGLSALCLKNIQRNKDGSFSWKPNLDALEQNAWKIKQPVIEGKSFTGETLFIKGGQSPFLKMKEWPDILKIFPRATYKTFTNAGHWVQVDAAEELYQVSRSFFSGDSSI